MGRDGADDPGSTQGMRSQTRRRWLAPAGVDSTGIELYIWASVRVCRYVLGGGQAVPSAQGMPLSTRCHASKHEEGLAR